MINGITTINAAAKKWDLNRSTIRRALKDYIENEDYEYSAGTIILKEILLEEKFGKMIKIMIDEKELLWVKDYVVSNGYYLSSDCMLLNSLEEVNFYGDTSNLYIDEHELLTDSDILRYEKEFEYFEILEPFDFFDYFSKEEEEKFLRNEEHILIPMEYFKSYATIHKVSFIRNCYLNGKLEKYLEKNKDYLIVDVIK